MKKGLHVFVEKPMAVSEAECRKMVEAAERADRKLMVGHTFLFNNAVYRIKELIDSGDLGEIYYVYVNRVNLGLFREDCNVVWDLAPHDIAILNWMLGASPERLTAVGHSYVQPGIEDVAFVNLQYPGKVMAHLHVSWLDPNKVRTITVVGSKKMLVYDDVSNTEKLRVYDKGVNVLPHYDSFGEFQLSYRYGDIVLPRIEDTEPLRNEAEHFIHAIRTGETSANEGTRAFSGVFADFQHRDQRAVAVIQKNDASGFEVRSQGMVEKQLDSVYPFAEPAVMFHGVVDNEISVRDSISFADFEQMQPVHFKG